MPDTEQTQPPIPRTVKTLGFVSLFNDIASEMIYPVIPIFLTSVLGAPIEVVGVIEGVAEATASFLKIISGWWSDKVKRRKPLVVGGYALSAISKPLFALAFSWPAVLVGRFLDRFGKGIRTAARDAWIADVTPKEIRGKSFGLHRMMDTIGAVAGPLITVAFLWRWPEQYRPLFIAAFVPGVIAVLLLMWLAREAPMRSEVSAQPKPKGSWRSIPRRFWWLLAVVVLFSLANSSDTFLILRGKYLGWSTVIAILAYALYNAIYALGAYPAGYLSDKIPRKYLMAGGFAVFAVVYYFFGTATTAGALWILFAVYGLSIALTDGTARALIADIAPGETYGVSYGIYSAGISAANLAASIWFGVVWQMLGVSLAFTISAGLAAVAAVAMLFLAPASKKN